MGRATEELADRVGPGIGGLLNVTFGNLPELLIAFFALLAGLQEVVKASIMGSILGNMLLVLGGAMFVGGLGRDQQSFNSRAASAQATMLILASAALIMPAVFEVVEGGGLPVPGAEDRDYSSSVEHVSLAVAIVLLVSYGAGLWFSLMSHRDLFNPPEDEGWEERRRTLEHQALGHPAGRRRPRGRPDVGDPRRLDRGDRRVHRAQPVLHRHHHRRRRGQRRRALGRGLCRGQGQDGPGGQHRHRLERAGRAVRRPAARRVVVLLRRRSRSRWCSTASSWPACCWR